MDEGELRENGKRKTNQYKPSQLKENQTIKLIMAERDKAIKERDLALAEKKVALVERDMAHLQKDTAIAERNIAIVERDNAFAFLKYARENCITSNCFYACSCCRVLEHVYHHQQHHIQHIHSSQQQLLDTSYNQTRDMQGDAFFTLTVAENGQKKQKVKRSRKEIKIELNTSKSVKSPRKSKLSGVENSDRQITIATTAEWRCDGGVAEDFSEQVSLTKHREWNNQDLGLNMVVYDESTIPVPVCSCTGKYHQCYKWGNGGWQSACCTTTLSMHPLPLLPNKRHARVGGRKMSGSAFRKLLSRLAAEGLDLSSPVDLKDRWAKHGTNRYITIK